MQRLYMYSSDSLTLHRYDGVSFGLANAWVWLHSNMTIRSKVQTLVERIVGRCVCCYRLFIPIVSDMKNVVWE